MRNSEEGRQNAAQSLLRAATGIAPGLPLWRLSEQWTAYTLAPARDDSSGRLPRPPAKRSGDLFGRRARPAARELADAAGTPAPHGNVDEFDRRTGAHHTRTLHPVARKTYSVSQHKSKRALPAPLLWSELSQHANR